MSVLKYVVCGIVLPFSGITLLVCGCKHDPAEPVAQMPISGDSVCFNTQILPLFVSNCTMTACHNTISRADGYQFTDYAGIKPGINNNKILKTIKATDPGDRMPPAGPLPAAQIQLIEKWIAQGATEKICANNCGAATSGGGINLESYSNVQSQTMNGKLICSVQQAGGCSPMPKYGNKLSFCDIRKLQLWKVSGCPQ
jgi:hypothetical protein